MHNQGAAMSDNQNGQVKIVSRETARSGNFFQTLMNFQHGTGKAQKEATKKIFNEEATPQQPPSDSQNQK